MRNRNHYLDILRGLAVFLMVFGHCIQYGNGTDLIESSGFFNNTLFALIYSFHMPLFMMLSGYLFFYTVRKCKNHETFIRNRFQRIILPIIGWQTVHYLIRAISMTIDKEPITIYFIYLYVRSWFTDIWFLLAILYCSIIVYLVRRYAKDSVIIYIVLMAFTFVTRDYFVANLSLYKYMYPCFVSGYLYAVHADNVKWLLEKISLEKWFGIAAISYAILFLFWDIDAYIYVSGHTLLGRENMIRQFLIDCYRLLIGFVGSFMMMLAVKLLYDWKPTAKMISVKVRQGIDYCQSLLEKIGKESLCIYLLSSEMVHLILEDYSDYFHFSYLGTLIETIILIFVCYWISVGIGKVSWLNQFLLGGR